MRLIFILSRLVTSTLLVSILAGCVYSQMNVITSPAGVNVYVKPLNRAEPRLLGQTPLLLPLSTVEPDFGGSGPVYLIFEKDGFRVEKFLVTDLSNIHLDISVDMVETHKVNNENDLDSLIGSFLEIQKLIRDKRFDDAAKNLKRVEGIAPHLSVVYELEGALYYIQKKYGEALQAYKLAVRYNPENIEANKMRRYLEAGSRQ